MCTLKGIFYLSFLTITSILLCCCSSDALHFDTFGTDQKPDSFRDSTELKLNIVVNALPLPEIMKSVSVIVDDSLYMLNADFGCEQATTFSSLFLPLNAEVFSKFAQTDTLHPLKISATIHCDNLTEYKCDTLFQSSLIQSEQAIMLPLNEWARQTYISTDYSQQGCIHELDVHDEGEGIRILFLGDGFSDRQIESGYYDQIMRKAADDFFSIEPMTQFRHLFDVWYMDAVSEVEGCSSDSTKASPNRSAFRTWFSNDTHMGGDQSAIMKFAAPVLGEGFGNQFNSVIIIVANSRKYAGTAYLYWPENYQSDQGDGWAFCFIPIALDDNRFSNLIHHEAVGHGFAKLGDEYYHEENGSYTEAIMTEYLVDDKLGWVKNIDITNDNALVKWHKMLSNPELVNLGIGIYEGALTYVHDFYRPTPTSIMRNNKGAFNAPSAEAIWYRIHKLAFGTWPYDQNAFYEWYIDYMNTNSLSSLPLITRYDVSETDMPAPPVIKTTRLE